MDQPFWEKTYQDQNVSTFGLLPNQDIAEMWAGFDRHWSILEVGCGEGKNALFLAAKGFDVHAFDISQAGIQKLKSAASKNNIRIDAWVQDLTGYDFDRSFNVILSYGTLHFVAKNEWKLFIKKAQNNTAPGGLNIFQIFTNRIPASPDIAPFVKGLAGEGELFSMYAGWEILSTKTHIFEDQHPGVAKHRHASNKIIARKVKV
jgi:cyclopropane fatty-acyl-phospholipid synthase-like methyltransferase